MKRLLLIVVCLIGSFSSFAAHIKGGWIYYEYLGAGSAPNTLKYKIILKVYRDCASNGGDVNNPQNNSTTPITIFNGTSSQIVMSVDANRIALYQLNKTTPNPCMSNPPSVCYWISEYQTTVELPQNPSGYTVSNQRCCRVIGIENLSPPSSNVGNTYTTTIPGTAVSAAFAQNNSPKFIENDTAVVCFNAPFTLNYAATDIDSDSLVYELCPALTGGDAGGATGQGVGASPDPSAAPPYNAPGYKSPYTALDPFSSGMVINRQTGIISGNAASTPGEYVVSVCVTEYRQGSLLSITHKELHVVVGNCTVSAALLGQDERTCNGLTFTFSNQSQSATIIGYQWSFGDGNSSTQPQPTHTYADTGRFLIKLKVTAAGGCQDSSTKYVYVFPGFVPKFNVIGSCYLNPYQFSSTTFTAYGTVDTTKWNFGDPNTLADTSNIANPSYLYPSVGTYSIKLYATNTKGCRKDTTQDLIVADKPQVQLPFKDTLICSIDTLQLFANANGGSYSWLPQPNAPNIIQNPNAQNPLVFPKDTTLFIVTVNNNGCINKDTVTVNVLDFIKVDAGLDTAICRTDTFRLKPVSDALSYLWTASTGVVVNPVKYPLVQPLVNTKYYVKANLGKCQDNDSVYVKVAPYPQVSVADVPAICFGNSVQLTGTIVGSNFFWSPNNRIINNTTLTPTVNPDTTTKYILTATDTVGCPKPVKDTVIVVVIPPVTANAGHDTAVVINQPLQMFVATNAASLSPVTHFLWTPNFGLNKDTIQNPIATINIIADSIKYHVQVTTADGCIGSDDIVVKVFKTEPDIFVPTAFTPNNDGKNDILKPICVGITRLDFFKVFNRWGQAIFETKEFDKGWNGKVGGIDQDSGTYVFVAQGVDYTGRVVFRKGTVVLIH